MYPVAHTLVLRAGYLNPRHMPRTPSSAARHVGAKVKAIRVDLHWTQDKLAVVSGIDSANIRALESGRSTPSLATVVRVAVALGVKPGDLVDDLSPEDFAAALSEPDPVATGPSRARGNSGAGALGATRRPVGGHWGL